MYMLTDTFVSILPTSSGEKNNNLYTNITQECYIKFIATHTIFSHYNIWDFINCHMSCFAISNMPTEHELNI